MKTLIIASSLSPKSQSLILCKKAEQLLRHKGVDVQLFDCGKIELKPYPNEPTKGMRQLIEATKKCNNIIFGMGVHNYTLSDSLKIIIDNCLNENTANFFGILCAAGGPMSYLVPMQLSQACMNQWRMIQLPRIVYASKKDFLDGDLCNESITERLGLFVDEFTLIGNKLLAH